MLSSTEVIKDMLAQVTTPTISEEQLASIVGVSRATLRSWRCTRANGPSFIKMGSRVAYPRASVVEWITENLVTPATATA